MTRTRTKSGRSVHCRRSVGLNKYAGRARLCAVDARDARNT
jgi:hypothetical protein